MTDMSWVTNMTAKPSFCWSSLILRHQRALRHHVERRGWFIHDHQLRREEQRHGDHGPLTHAATQLMWVACRVGHIDADHMQHLG